MLENPFIKFRSVFCIVFQLLNFHSFVKSKTHACMTPIFLNYICLDHFAPALQPGQRVKGLVSE